METLISSPFYSVLFIGAGMLFLFLEVFIPSGGILGVLALGCTVFGIYGLFHQQHYVIGAGSILVAGGLTVLLVRFGLRRLTFSGNMTPETSSSVDERIDGLLGKEGRTHTALRPAGVAIIEGKRVDVVTPGHFIEANVPVRVIDSSGNWVVVQEVSRRDEAQ